MRKLFIYCAILSSLVGIASCKKSSKVANTEAAVPTVTINAISNISEKSAKTGGAITNDGGLLIIEKGICWSTTPNPSVADSILVFGPGKENFEGLVNKLTANTTYFVRTFAENASGIGYSEVLNFKTNPLTPIQLTIGQNYEGGIIFFIDATGQHGKVTTASDIGATIWGCEGTNVAGTSTSISSGYTNTVAISNSCSDLNSAAQFCLNSTFSNKSDWYLPSKDELKLIWQKLYLTNLASFQEDEYWTSSQISVNTAWAQYFTSSLVQVGATKDLNSLRVRPVRIF